MPRAITSKSTSKLLPSVPSLWQIIGPSFIFLGLGLGSGELIVWPYLVANNGLGIVWAAILGLTLQFFMNMEIERYALARGESIFVGFWRKWKVFPTWFILSTFVPWVWPGLVTTSAQLFANLFQLQGRLWGVKELPQWHVVIAIGLLLLLGLILSVGKNVYSTVEQLQKTLIFISVPFIFGLSAIFFEVDNFDPLAFALFGLGTTSTGQSYWLIPWGMALAPFLAGLAYSGAGGNLNLSQSFYIKDKGYGMGKYSEKIKSLFSGEQSKKEISLIGGDFPKTRGEIKKFFGWWRVVNLEHAFVFLMTGGVTIIFLCLLAYNTAYGKPNLAEGLSFLTIESHLIGLKFGAWLGQFFLVVIAVTLFATQLTVFDATSRIMAENLSLLFPQMYPAKNLAKYFYVFLWLQIVAGIGILLVGFSQPFVLIVLAACLNAVAMFVHSGLTLWVNKTLLYKEIRPGFWRTAIMIFACSFYGFFSLMTLFQYLKGH